MLHLLIPIIFSLSSCRATSFFKGYPGVNDSK
ncbi:hypothetical protein M084_4812, partial [Bacteroides fragilis str. 3988 T1]